MTNDDGRERLPAPTAATATFLPTQHNPSARTTLAPTPTPAGSRERLRRAWAAIPDAPGRALIERLARAWQRQRERGPLPRLRPAGAAYAVAAAVRYMPTAGTTIANRYGLTADQLDRETARLRAVGWPDAEIRAALGDDAVEPVCTCPCRTAEAA